MPSRWEACPYVALEAMAAGRPVVASAVDGLEDIVVPGETGMLVAPGSPAELTTALERLAGDRAFRRRLGEAGRARVERMFGIDRMVAGTLAVYEDAIASRGA